MQHHRAVLAHRVQHRGVFRLGHRLANDLQAFGFKMLEVGRAHLQHIDRTDLAACVQYGRVPQQSELNQFWRSGLPANVDQATTGEDDDVLGDVGLQATQCSA
ncbi:hypothetical protein D3C75_1079470 [compost metagenome]